MRLKDIPPEETGFDIDGVVSDTMASFIAIAARDYGINNIVKENITSYWLEECLPVPDEIIGEIIEKILTDPFGTGLEPLPGAIEALTAISRRAPLLFVTARPLKKPIEEWLCHKLPEVPEEKIRVIATGEHSAKAEVLASNSIKYFIEDHLTTCRQIADAGINAIVFDQPWNREDSEIPRVRSWQEILSCMNL